MTTPAVWGPSADSSRLEVQLQWRLCRRSWLTMSDFRSSYTVVDCRRPTFPVAASPVSSGESRNSKRGRQYISPIVINLSLMHTTNYMPFILEKGGLLTRILSQKGVGGRRHPPPLRIRRWSCVKRTITFMHVTAVFTVPIRVIWRLVFLSVPLSTSCCVWNWLASLSDVVIPFVTYLLTYLHVYTNCHHPQGQCRRRPAKTYDMI